MSIFKANDVRGRYGSELTEKEAYRIGRAFVVFNKAKEVIVGRDMRVSSPSLAHELIRGITDQGADVLTLNLVDSPGLYFATYLLKKPGIMVTASHNPAKDNGFYLCKSNAIVINEKIGMKKIESLVKKGKFPISKYQGTVKHLTLNKEYVNHILSFVQRSNFEKRIKVVIDAGNGMGGWIAPIVYQHLPIEVIPMYFNLDGTFPHHVPNPAIYDTLEELSKRVIKEKADFGIAYDGDVDRAGFVDEKGKVIEGSIVGAIIAKHLLKKHPKNSIVYSSTCSRILPETIIENHGKPIRDKVGHTFIKARMRQVKALFGIENTGHYMYKSNSYADSGIITSILMCELYAKQHKKMSDLVKPFEKYFKVPEINFSTENAPKVLSKLKPLIKSLKPIKLDVFDGLHADMGDYWFSIRASQTEPLLRLVIEGKSQKSIENAERSLVKLIKQNLTK